MTESPRVVIAGGAGRVGARVAELLLGTGGHVVVADLAPGRFPPGVDFCSIDARTPSTLVDAFSGAAAVVNTIGPYDQWGTVVLDAAITAGVPYVDVCDDPGATELMLARDGAARSAGVPALVGMGSTPGLSNLLAVVAARGLDQCRDLVVFWGASRDEVSASEAAVVAEQWAAFFRKGRAAVTHFFEQISGDVPVWRAGKPGLAPAWTVPVQVRTSDGRGGTYRLVGHPEPVTLPRSLQSEGIYCLGTCGASIDRVLARVVQRIEAGELSVDDAGDATADLLEADPLALVATAETRAIGSFVGVLAQGVAQGREETVIVLPGGPTDGSLSIETARPAAVAVGFLPDLRAGVHAPEAVLVPNEFLRVYAARYWDGVEPYTVDRQPGVLVDPSVFAPTRGRSST